MDKSAQGTMAQPPPIMTFESWWNENGKSWCIQLIFDTASSLCKLRMPAEVVVEAKAVDGSRLAPYDLFVGATIVVLRRRAILKKASLDTQKWLDVEAHRLVHAKCVAENELGKFTSISMEPFSLPLPHRMHTHSMYGRYGDMGGRVNLRRLSKEVDGLIAELRQYKAHLPAVLDSKGGGEKAQVDGAWSIEALRCGSDAKLAKKRGKLRGSLGRLHRKVGRQGFNHLEWLESIPLAASAAGLTKIPRASAVPSHPESLPLS